MCQAKQVLLIGLLFFTFTCATAIQEAHGARSNAILPNNQEINKQEKSVNDQLKNKVYRVDKSITFAAENGKKETFSDFRGKIVAVILWSVWSVDSIMELQDMNFLCKKVNENEEIRDKIVFLPINIGGSKLTTYPKNIYSSRHIDCLSIHTAPKNILSQLDVAILPSVIVLDNTSVIQIKLDGYKNSNYDKISQTMSELLKIDLKTTSKTKKGSPSAPTITGLTPKDDDVQN